MVQAEPPHRFGTLIFMADVLLFDQRDGYRCVYELKYYLANYQVGRIPNNQSHKRYDTGNPVKYPTVWIPVIVIYIRSDTGYLDPSLYTLSGIPVIKAKELCPEIRIPSPLDTGNTGGTIVVFCTGPHSMDNTAARVKMADLCQLQIW